MSVGPSDHFDGRRFVNPDGTAGQPFFKVPRMLLARRTPWPDAIDAPAQTPPALDGADAVVTFVGHATFLIQTPAGNILTDPMYSQRAGPLNVIGPRRVRRPAVGFDDLPPIALVLLSHNHYDHCDVPLGPEPVERQFAPQVHRQPAPAPLPRPAQPQLGEPARTTAASGRTPSQRSSGNSDRGRGAAAPSSRTAIDLRQASSCRSLISPRYSSGRCTTRPPPTRQFSTMLQ